MEAEEKAGREDTAPRTSRGAALPAATGSLTIVPCNIGDANAFVRQHHRHHGPTQSGLFACVVALEGEIVGVAIVGRPVSRMLQDGWTAEVTRVCTTGAKNASSMLYGACWRAAKTLGWRRLITYTLPTEGGGISPRRRLAPDRRSWWWLLVAYVAASRRPTPDADEAQMGGVRAA